MKLLKSVTYVLFLVVICNQFLKENVNAKEIKALDVDRNVIREGFQWYFDFKRTGYKAGDIARRFYRNPRNADVVLRWSPYIFAQFSTEHESEENVAAVGYAHLVIQKYAAMLETLYLNGDDEPLDGALKEQSFIELNGQIGNLFIMIGDDLIVSNSLNKSKLLNKRKLLSTIKTEEIKDAVNKLSMPANEDECVSILAWTKDDKPFIHAFILVINEGLDFKEKKACIDKYLHQAFGFAVHPHVFFDNDKNRVDYTNGMHTLLLRFTKLCEQESDDKRAHFECLDKKILTYFKFWNQIFDPIQDGG